MTKSLLITNEEALEIAVNCALEGTLPDSSQLETMKSAGVDYNKVHNILKDVFYGGEGFEETDSE